MKNIEIKITKSTRYVDFENDNEKVGNIGENLQTMLVFSFTDEFVNGQARLEYIINGESQYVFMKKIGETYQTPVTSQLAQCGSVDLQLVITEGTDENEIPKFKSNVFYLPFGKSINAEIEQPEEYEEWIDVANAKLNEIDESLMEVETQSAYAKEQGDYAKQEGTKVDEVVDYVVKTSEEANEKSDTAISIAEGANQTIVFGNYETMITAFNNLPMDTYKTGQNILIITLNVPDLWISSIEEESTPYTYVDDDTFVNELKTNGIIKVGYFVLSALETQKVDLTDYAKTEDLPKVSYTYGIYKTTGGILFIDRATESAIDSRTSDYKPIVPSNLDYAVKSVVGGHVTLTQAEYDALETKDENTYYNIVEE